MTHRVTGLAPSKSKSVQDARICDGRDCMHPMFTETLFITAKIWKQPKCPSVGEWINNYGHLHNGILHSHKKEEKFTLCDSMDRTGEHYAT